MRIRALPWSAGVSSRKISRIVVPAYRGSGLQAGVLRSRAPGSPGEARRVFRRRGSQARGAGGSSLTIRVLDIDCHRKSARVWRFSQAAGAFVSFLNFLTSLLLNEFVIDIFSPAITGGMRAAPC